MEMSINTKSAEASQGLLREVSTEARDDWQREYLMEMDWQREYLMEMSINTTSAEASQRLLREVGKMY